MNHKLAAFISLTLARFSTPLALRFFRWYCERIAPKEDA